MSDGKLTDEQVTDLVDILRSDSSTDAKVALVNVVKSGIKQHNVPETSIAQLFEGLRSASSSQHAALVNVGFTSLNHLLTRLTRQDPKLLSKEAARTLPLIVEKLGDQKDKIRSTAMQSLNTFYSVAPAEVERTMRNQALVGKNLRAKESGMQWLLQTHQEQGLQFRSYVPLLMDLLEDADGMVRDVAKNTVIELFKNAPNAAKSDLKRQLKNFKVRPAIEQSIIKSLGAPGARPETPAAEAPAPAPAPAPARTFAASTSSAPTERPITPAVESTENIEPQYVNTNRELDDMFKGMAWFFEGRESEGNWVQRERSLGTLRRLIAGNVPSDFPDTFMAGLKSMLDGIIKATTSLRTSLFKEGCGLIQDIAITFGPAMDPLVELLLQMLLKLSAGTKKIATQLASHTLDTMISRVSYNQRIMQHMWSACQDKNVQPRTYVTSWLKTILKKEAAHKSHLEHSGGVELMEKCIKKGLGDPNPAVREQMRSTFWAYWSGWPQRADAIKEDLDATAQKLLNKDPSNPNSPQKGEAARPGLGLSKSTMSSKPSLREHMMAQKKKGGLEAKKLPARPGSAMANISPMRKVSDPADSKPSAATKPTGSRTRPEAGTISVKSSGMSVAPMRPTRRRPEMAARPATAGPYSMRDQPSLEDSPGARPRAPISRQPKETPPRRTAQKPRPGHASHASESGINSANARPKAAAASPRPSPAKLKTMQTAPAATPAAPEPPQLVSPDEPVPEPTLEAPTTTDLADPSPQPDEEPRPTKQPESEITQEPEPEATQEPGPEPTQEPEPEPVQEPEQQQAQVDAAPQPTVPEITLDSEPQSPALEVYEDPFVEDSTTPKPTVTGPVLEEKPVNEDAANLRATNTDQPISDDPNQSPEKVRQNARLLDSGISKIKAKSLEVHGFRKFQSLIRDNKTVFSDDKFETVLLGLFQYLEDPLSGTAPDKAQDVKAQILTTIKLLLKKERDNFQPHVSKCLESLLQTRSAYDNRAHIVSGLELLSDDLVSLGDPTEIIVVLTRRLGSSTDSTTEGCRALSMGLHVLKALLDKRDESNALAEPELVQLSQLAGRCLESTDSGVRMDAVQLCVALHARVGEETFWEAMKGTKDDPKSLITYYIVKRQREQAA